MDFIARRAVRHRPFICRSCSIKLRRRNLSTHTASKPSFYDVVCVGGGPVGLALATALRSSPATSMLSIALIESQDLAKATEWTPPPDTYSNRASSLTPASRRFLQKIGAWSHMDTSRIQPFERMAVWDGISGAKIEFEWDAQRRSKYADPEDSAVAYMTENPNILRGLLQRQNELGRVDIFNKTKVEAVEFGPELPSSEPAENSGSDISSLDLSSWPHLILSDNSTLAARLLVGADGFNSPVRHFASIESRGWDYNRHGVVATLRLTEPLQEPVTAYQRFLPTGPIALLPLPGNFATLVWSTTPERAAHLKKLSPDDFVAAVNAGFRLGTADLDYIHSIDGGLSEELQWRVQHTAQSGFFADGAIELPGFVQAVQEGSVASFPLRLRHADTYATHRVALAGDAAHTVHPMAGQGLNMGLADVESLAGVVEFAVSHGMDIGDQLSLERYNAERYEVNNRFMGVVDKLHKLYAVESGPIVGLRSLGLGAVARMGPVKEFLMRQAAG